MEWILGFFGKWLGVVVMKNGGLKFVVFVYVDVGIMLFLSVCFCVCGCSSWLCVVCVD